MSATTVLAIAPPVSRWRHARAVALLPFMNTVAIPFVLLSLSPPAAAPSFVVGSIGLLLGAAGATLVAHSVRLFIRGGHGTLAPWDPTRELVTEGAYRFSRNPMKAGLFLVLAAEALLFRSLPLTVWLLAFALANVVYIRVSEEPGLRARFGARYRDYCEQVPRWWPTSWTPRFARRSATRS